MPDPRLSGFFRSRISRPRLCPAISIVRVPSAWTAPLASPRLLLFALTCVSSVSVVSSLIGPRSAAHAGTCHAPASRAAAIPSANRLVRAVFFMSNNLLSCHADGYTICICQTNRHKQRFPKNQPAFCAALCPHSFRALKNATQKSTQNLCKDNDVILTHIPAASSCIAQVTLRYGNRRHSDSVHHPPISL